jgi:uncharacterized protein (DUF58 family)
VQAADADTDPRGTRVRFRRTYILPTTDGLLFGLMLLVMLVGAINYAAALAYALVFLLAGVVLVTPLHTQGNLQGLSLRLGPVAPVHAGQPLRLVVVVSADDTRARPGLRLTARALRRGRGMPRREASLDFSLPAGGTALTLELPWQAGARGRLPLPGFELSTRHPLGLFRAWAPVTVSGEVLVWPAVVDVLPPPPPADAIGGEAASDRAAGTEEFRGLSAYRPGDSPRRLAWRAWRPGQAPPVKRFGSGGDPQVFDWVATEALADTEARLSQLAAWVLAAERAGAPFGLVLPGQTFAPATGGAHLRDVMAALALYEAAG